VPKGRSWRRAWKFLSSRRLSAGIGLTGEVPAKAPLSGRVLALDVAIGGLPETMSGPSRG